MTTPHAITSSSPPAWTIFPHPDESVLDPERYVIDSRFRPIRELGRGGMGCVLLCEDRVLRSRAAVKILLAKDPESRRRFLEEATLLANIRHPYLVQVLTSGRTEDGAPYMAMEYLGPSLAERLADDEPLSWQEVVECAGQVATALAALHRAHVIHRDVKPENIVVLRGVTGRTFVKLIDLGIARIEDLAEIQGGGEPLPPKRRTEAGIALGTRGYIPPEAGLVPAAPSFDIFSLGVTIYRLCTGLMPNLLEPRSMREVLRNSDLPQALDELVQRSISVLPEDRPSSATSVARELASIKAASADGRRPVVLFDDCYELLELLGIGAKAEVYRAYNRETRRYVALKILREEVVDDPEERRRFDREVRVLSMLDHPAIPKLIDCRTSAGRWRPFIAMELRGGVRVGELDTLPLRELTEVARQLAGALEKMHSAGIIHRDLNRSNVLIELFEDGRAPRASIIDFGQVELTKVFYAQTEERYLTRPELRVVLGSGNLEHAEWSAPEARAGHGWTAASDVFSLGLLLFLLVTGKRPVERLPGVWSSPADHVPECRGSLADAIVGALQMDPKHRLDAAGVGRDLEYAAEEIGGFGPPAATPAQAPIERAASEPVSPSESAGRSLVSFRVLLVAVAVAVAVAVSVAAWTIGQGLRQGERSDATRFARAARALIVSEVPPPAEGTDLAADEKRGRPAGDNDASRSADEIDEEPPEVPRVSAAVAARDTEKQPPPSMRQAVRRVESSLRVCSALADGLLLVEFSTDGSDRFAAVTPVAETDAAILKCVRRATQNIRFRPTSRPKFTEEYRP